MDNAKRLHDLTTEYLRSDNHPSGSKGFRLFLVDKIIWMEAEIDRRSKVALVREAYCKELQAEVERLREAVRTAYFKGHEDTVEGCFAWCDEGSKEVADDVIAAGEKL